MRQAALGHKPTGAAKVLFWLKSSRIKLWQKLPKSLFFKVKKSVAIGMKSKRSGTSRGWLLSKYWNKLAERLRIDGALSASSYCSSRASVSGHIHHANSFHLRKKLALWKWSDSIRNKNNKGHVIDYRNYSYAYFPWWKWNINKKWRDILHCRLIYCRWSSKDSKSLSKMATK